MQDRIYPTKWEPTTVAMPWPDSTKMRYPRVFQKRGPQINPFSKEVHEYTNEEKKKVVEDNRKFREAMDLLYAKFEIEKREMVIISFDQLKLEEEVKAEDDECEDDVVEEDRANLQEELLDEVEELVHDRVTKETERLV